MALFLVATLVPAVTTQVATFQVVNSFGLFNTRWAPILLYMGTDIVAIYVAPGAGGWAERGRVAADRPATAARAR